MSEQTSRLRLAVLSSKGGCGRSTVAVNLAYLLAAAGRRVALIDLAQFGSLALLLELHRAPGVGLGPVAACLSSVHAGELDDVLTTAITTCRMGGRQIALLPAAPPQRQDDLEVDGVVRVLHALTDAGYDLVLDTSHELSDRLAGVLHGATHQLWVLSPDPAAGWHLLQAREVARQIGAPAVPTGILLNRYHRRCGLRAADLESVAELPVWGILPDTPRKLPLAAHRGAPLLVNQSGRWRSVLTRVLEQTGVPCGQSWWPLRRGERKEVAHGQV